MINVAINRFYSKRSSDTATSLEITEATHRLELGEENERNIP